MAEKKERKPENKAPHTPCEKVLNISLVSSVPPPNSVYLTQMPYRLKATQN